jgi:HSP20 family protein
MLSFRDALDRLFDETLWESGWKDVARWRNGAIPLDIYEKGANVVVKASIPGVKPSDLDVEVRDDVLSVCGKVDEDQEEKKDNYYMREQRRGRFERSVVLPSPVIADRAEAVFENGVLTLTLPKSAQASGRKIRIQGK